MNKNTILALILGAGLLFFALKGKAAPANPPTNPKLPGKSNGTTTGQIVGQAASTAGEILKKLFGTGGSGSGGGNGTQAGHNSGQGTAGRATGGSGRNGAQAQPTPQQLATAGYSVSGNDIKDASGNTIGHFNDQNDMVMNDGSVIYADGVIWDQSLGYFYDSTGDVWTDNGIMVGHLDSDGNMEAIDGAMFGSNNELIGWDNADGSSYTSVNGDIIDISSETVIGYDNGDGTWTEAGTNNVYDDSDQLLGTQNEYGDGWVNSQGDETFYGDYIGD